jgi:hypothetical protein
MITYRNMDIVELKKDYSETHGFVFQGPIKSSDKAYEHLCDILINHNITKEHPQFLVRLDEVTTAFVYKNDFDAPTFFHKADVATQMGVCVIEPLCLFLKSK